MSDEKLFMDLKKHFSRRYKPPQKDKVVEKKLEEHTTGFVSFLRKGAKNDEFSFLLLTFGTGGGGKTALAFIIISILMASDKTRKLALWQTPPALEQAVKEQIRKFMDVDVAENWCSRVRTLTFIKQIEPNDIILVDEGVINLNAKEALTNDAKKFEQFITGARHLRVVVIVNSITDGVVRAFRIASQIQFYKRMPERMRKTLLSDSDFIKEFGNKLDQLEPWESLFESDHKYFSANGLISLKLSDYCPWYNDDISKSLATTGSADFGEEKDKEIERRITDIAIKAIDYFSDKEEKVWANARVIRAWMRKYHYDDWRIIGGRSRDIIDTIKLKMIEEGNDAAVKIEELEDEEKGELSEQEYDSLLGEDVVEKLKSPTEEEKARKKEIETECMKMAKYFYKCAKQQGYSDELARIAEYTVKGFALQDLAQLSQIGYSEGYVTKIRKEMQEKYFGYWTEWWFAVAIGEEPNTAMNDNVPDFITTKEVTYGGKTFPPETIFSIKFRLKPRNSETFYQNGGLNDQLEPNLTPEWREAKRRGCNYFLAYFNPKWSTEHFHLKELDPNGSIIVNIQKPDSEKIWID